MPLLSFYYTLPLFDLNIKNSNIIATIIVLREHSSQSFPVFSDLYHTMDKVSVVHSEIKHLSSTGK